MPFLGNHKKTKLQVLYRKEMFLKTKRKKMGNKTTQMCPHLPAHLWTHYRPQCGSGGYCHPPGRGHYRLMVLLNMKQTKAKQHWCDCDCNLACVDSTDNSISYSMYKNDVIQEDVLKFTIKADCQSGILYIHP